MSRKALFGGNLVNGTMWAVVAWTLGFVSGPHGQLWPVYLIAALFVLGVILMNYDHVKRVIWERFHWEIVERGKAFRRSDGLIVNTWRDKSRSYMQPLNATVRLGAKLGILVRRRNGTVQKIDV